MSLLCMLHFMNPLWIAPKAIIALAVRVIPDVIQFKSAKMPAQRVCAQYLRIPAKRVNKHHIASSVVFIGMHVYSDKLTPKALVRGYSLSRGCNF